MSWDEFADLLNGLNETTPLARMVQVRTETDPEVIKTYTTGQRKIRADWQRHLASQKTKAETDNFLIMLEEALKKNYMKGE